MLLKLRYITAYRKASFLRPLKLSRCSGITTMISNHAQTQQQANGSKNKILFSSNLKKGQVFQGKNRKIKVDI